jgi:hypothetical protein
MGPIEDAERIDPDQGTAGPRLAGCSIPISGEPVSRAIIVATMLSLAVPAAAEEKMVVNMGKLT